MIKQIANIIQSWNDGFTSYDEAGANFANLLSENTGKSCINTTIDMLKIIDGVPYQKGYVPCLLNIPFDPKDDKEAKWMLEGIKTGEITAEFYVTPSYAMTKED